MNAEEYSNYNATRVRNALNDIEKNLDGRNYRVKFDFNFLKIESSADEDPEKVLLKFHHFPRYHENFNVIDASHFAIKLQHECILNFIQSSAEQFLPDEDELKTFSVQLFDATYALGYFSIELTNFIHTNDCKIYALYGSGVFTWWESFYVLINNNLKLAAVIHGYGHDG